ncbi:MAG: bifunctional UDP-N-acetylmuramoyl-tripeptide:D-alanyl-D-alanine ligase/alanine racemase [Sphingobacteriales bacterium]|nr:bifunctional UDP-N-acetylmuramoyl-tripeptide:D-alanyl-D-alanine ligase/alanine racemase [Sphingobacteriales bacterium]
MQFTIREIKELTDGKFLFFSSDDTIKYVVTDSRNFLRKQNAVFIAIKGQNNDGHKYIRELAEKGIRNFIIDNQRFIEDLPENIIHGLNVILCHNSVDALQQIAFAHRKKFKIPVAAVTGSNGKTIVKEWIAQLSANVKKVRVSPKSYNSQIGVPFSLLTLNESDEMAVFEAGISTVGEMQKLAGIIDPESGILTNIGNAHQEGFSTIEQKLREKLLLFRNSSKLIYCKDHEFIDTYIHKLKKEGFFNKNIELVTWSLKPDGDSKLKITHQEITTAGRKVSFEWQGKTYSFLIPFSDQASFENCLHALLFLLEYHFSPDYLTSRMADLQPVEMRLEIKEGIHSCLLINDTYNSDINSLAIALDNLVYQGKNRKKTAIISDILQSGTNPEQMYSHISQMLRLRNIDKVIGIGKNMKRFENLFDKNASFYLSTDEFLKNINPDSFRDEAILIKGARVFSFEKITALLQRKIHATVLEINLNHLIHNLNVFRSKLKPDTKVMAMVKAFSYGSGNINVSNILEYNQVDYFGVAYADEGIELVNAGIRKPIMVMNPDIESLSSILSYGLEPEIYSFRLLNTLTDIYRKSPFSNKVKIHLKFDTGMHRLGFSLTDVPEIALILEKNPYLDVASVFTHLSSAEISDYDSFTLNQLTVFEKICKELKSKGINGFLRHALNSAAIIRFNDHQYEMVRLGIGLYGIDITGNIQESLKNVITFKTVISQIKEIEAGESVGYSRSYIAKKNMRIATIGVGYADGFPRKLGNGTGQVLVNGHKVPVIGNVCMDMTMIDISDIPANEGDEVIIFGDELPLSEISKGLETIPYEVLTNISQRVKRVYYKE